MRYRPDEAARTTEEASRKDAEAAHARGALTMYLEMQLPGARQRLAQKIAEMQEHLGYVARDLEKHHTTTKLNVLPNMLAEVQHLHERIEVLTNVAKLHDIKV